MPLGMYAALLWTWRKLRMYPGLTMSNSPLTPTLGMVRSSWMGILSVGLRRVFLEAARTAKRNTFPVEPHAGLSIGDCLTV